MRKAAKTLKPLAVSLLVASVPLLLFAGEGVTLTQTILESPKTGIAAALKTLDKLNEELDELIEWEQDYADMPYMGRLISEESHSDERLERHRRIHALKRKAIDQMPDYLGKTFAWWHDTFNAINDMMDCAWVFGAREEFDEMLDALGYAKGHKDEVEEALEEQPSQATP